MKEKIQNNKVEKISSLQDTETTQETIANTPAPIEITKILYNRREGSINLKIKDREDLRMMTYRNSQENKSSKPSSDEKDQTILTLKNQCERFEVLISEKSLEIEKLQKALFHQMEVVKGAQIVNSILEKQLLETRNLNHKLQLELNSSTDKLREAKTDQELKENLTNDRNVAISAT